MSSSSLAEFLKHEAREKREKYSAMEAEVRAWQAAVEKLLSEMEEVLRQADTDGILQIERTSHRLREMGYGPYDVPGLSIFLGDRYVDIEPVARRVMIPIEEENGQIVRTAAGRVDMNNGEWKYILYRFTAPGGDRWRMTDDRDFSKRPFDRAAFEGAILSMLR
jgi:hypothetical protein